MDWDRASSTCTACTQRAIAKGLSKSRWSGSDTVHAENNLRACYDDGNGTTCYAHVQRLLSLSYGVEFNPDTGTVQQYGRLEPCHYPINLCQTPECRPVLKDVIRDAGCCASAVPAALYGLNNHIPSGHCLWSMMKASPSGGPCQAPVEYGVEITVDSREPDALICDLVRYDLSTTLAMDPDLIRCDRIESDLDRQLPGMVTVLATIRRYRSHGMPSSVAFDPDLLQETVVRVVTRSATRGEVRA